MIPKDDETLWYSNVKKVHQCVSPSARCVFFGANIAQRFHVFIFVIIEFLKKIFAPKSTMERLDVPPPTFFSLARSQITATMAAEKTA
jgi:hypothetical protein